jgi:hypothetical protein
MSEPVKIMLDGMTKKPIAIPFPFSIGGWIINDSDDWHSFKRINADLEFHADKRLELLRQCKRMLRHLALTYPRQVFEKDIGILLLITEIQQELGDGRK